MRTLVVTALAAAGCRCASIGPPEARDHRDAPVPAAVVAGPVCGMCFAHNWQHEGRRGYGSETARESLDELAALGIRTVSLTPFGWMRSLRSAEVRWQRQPKGAETHERVRAAARQARERGMTVMLKPHLWVGHGRNRGDIHPTEESGGWPSWFESFRPFVLEHARLAADIEADWYVIGVEMSGAVRENPGFFVRLIDDVRSVYDGKLTYAANWNELEEVGFWSALDAIGVQLYAPLLRDGEPPTEANMESNAQRWLDRFEALSAEVGRPIVVTEVGFTNRVGAARQPWHWPEHVEDATATTTGDAEQAAAYRAILSTFGRSRKVAAIYWWKWFTDPDTDEEKEVGFSPRGRLPARILAEACRPVERR